MRGRGLKRPGRSLDEKTGEFEGDSLDWGPRRITTDEDYAADLVVFDRPVGELHGAFLDAGFDVRRVIEHRRSEVEGTDPEESDLPEVFWRVPQRVRFWAVAERDSGPLRLRVLDPPSPI